MSEIKPCSSQACCIFLRGNIYMRDAAEACTDAAKKPKPFEPVGEVTGFGFTPKISTIGGKRSMQLDGGTTCSLKIMEGLDVSIQVNCLKSSNLAMAFYGETGSVGGSSTIETIPGDLVLQGGMVMLKYVGAKNVQVTSPTGAIEGIDFKVIPGGLEILKGSAAILDGEDITVSYQYATNERTELAIKTNTSKEIYFSGRDQNGQGFVVRLYSVSLGASSEVKFLSEDFLSFTLGGTAESDSTQPLVPFSPGMPVSNYGYIQRS